MPISYSKKTPKQFEGNEDTDQLFLRCLKDPRYANDRQFFDALNNLVPQQNVALNRYESIVLKQELHNLLTEIRRSPSTASLDDPRAELRNPNAEMLTIDIPHKISLKLFLAKLQQNKILLSNTRILRILVNMAEAVKRYHDAHPGEETHHGHVNLANFNFNPITDEVTLLPPGNLRETNTEKRNRHYLPEEVSENPDDDTYSLCVCMSKFFNFGHTVKLQFWGDVIERYDFYPDDKTSQRLLSDGSQIVLGQIREMLQTTFQEIDGDIDSRRKPAQRLNNLVKEFSSFEDRFKKNDITASLFKQNAHQNVILHHRLVAELDEGTKQFLMLCDDVKIHVPRGKGKQQKYQKMIRELRDMGIKVSGTIDVEKGARERRVIALCDEMQTTNTLVGDDKPQIYRYLSKKKFTPKQALLLYEAGINLTLETSAKATYSQYAAALNGLFKEEDEINKRKGRLKPLHEIAQCEKKIAVIQHARQALNMHFQQDNLSQEMLFDILSSAQEQMLNTDSFRNTLSQVFRFFGVRAFTSQEEKNINELKQKVLRS